MKYSKNFERDYNFYLKNRNVFNFCGGQTKYQAIPDEKGYSAKECLLSIDSTGKNIPCCEPELLNKLLLCKASVNFNIKLWADGIKRETFLPMDLLEIQREYECPRWVVDAVINQAKKLERRE